MRALIVGDAGQDGRLLWQLLSEAEYELAGVSRNSVRLTPGCKIEPPPRIEETARWVAWIGAFKPDEIYYLPAYHCSAEGPPVHSPGEIAEISRQVHVTGIGNVLSAVSKAHPSARVFYASTSFVFAPPTTPVQSETSPMQPGDIYGKTKLAGMRLCEKYRRERGVFASVGILYNHESIYRKDNFLSRKIIQTALRISRGSNEKLVLGDFSSVVDWGYAPDFVRAFHLILQAEKPDTFIVATGEGHTVAEFAAIAFSHLGLNWKEHVKEDPSILTRPTVTRIGDSTHLRKTTGWKPGLSFEAFIAKMIDETAS